MDFILYISQAIIPIVVFYIVCYGIMKKREVFSDFVEGAKKGALMVGQIMPTLIGLMVAVGIMRSCGLFDVIGKVVRPIAAILHFPEELVPLSIIKMFSSSAASGMLLDIYKEYGADSSTGKIASIMMSCTETIFYTMSVYFLAAKVKKTRWTLAGALICTLAGTIAAVLLAGMA